MPRLAVIDAAAVDGRRRLVLVRRDNVEHLLMIGGPSDIVVEPNIVRAMPQPRADGAAPGTRRQPPRIAPLPDAAWAKATRADLRSSRRLITANRKCRSRRRGRRGPPSPTKCAAPRRADAGTPQRSVDRLRAGADRRPPRAGAPRSRREPLMPRPQRDRPSRRSATPAGPRRAAVPQRREHRSPRRAADPRACRRDAPRPWPRPRAAAPRRRRLRRRPAPSSADQNLAEMAQRLEAALRRPADAIGAAGGAGNAAAADRPAASRRDRAAAPRRKRLRQSRRRDGAACWAARRTLREAAGLSA